MPQTEEFISNLPFKLTNAQNIVLNEIFEDMNSDKPMNRLIQGDVGSGKTIVAFIALFNSVLNGYQGALMAPTEILAEQHYNSAKEMLERYGIKIELLVGSLTSKQKAKALENIKSGAVDIVIGTHALIEDNVVFDKLGLVVTDEQHRFGVRQRSMLSSKGSNPDVLVMTATPIPRTLALILYGDLDISIINELPPGRKKIETYAVDNSMRERAYSFIKKEISSGRQVYVVCPLIEDSESITAKSVVEHYEKLQNYFKEYKVSYLHGKMKANEKEDAIRDFKDKKVDILVSTTVIEVGVNIPNASIMMIENSERFGLAQLHQLRGRVGRGEYQSYCILFNEGQSKISKERMKIMSKTNDGFEISEKDLQLRGPGEFFGTRQHGLPDLKIANLFRDMEILKMVQKLCLEILSVDKTLSKPEHILIKEKIEQKLKELNSSEFTM
jgi:ATP-dependent DNA helicase RecG